MDHRVKPGGDDRACGVAVNQIDRNKKKREASE
jgi:hypothetical protein